VDSINICKNISRELLRAFVLIYLNNNSFNSFLFKKLK
jgi:hypothetical protein